MIIAMRRSPMTGDIHAVDMDVTEAELKTWCESRLPIQKCLPFLSVDEREFLLSGYTPSDWKAIERMCEDLGEEGGGSTHGG